MSNSECKFEEISKRKPTRLDTGSGSPKSERSSVPHESPYPISSNTPSVSSPTVFVRETTKFWVLPSNCVEVKNVISRHIPEWRYDNKVSPSMAESGSWISSIYFDQANWDLYRTRLLRSDSSMLFRWRWYSKEKPINMGFMEQKIRNPGWRGEYSIKKRFEMDQYTCMKFLKYGSDCFKERYQLNSLPLEMSDDMKKWGPEFYPKIRTTYRRTVFQEYNGADTRASFDEDMILSSVSHFNQGVEMDVDQTSASSFVFPIGVLEVKLAFDSRTRNRNEMLPLPD